MKTTLLSKIGVSDPRTIAQAIGPVIQNKLVGTQGLGELTGGEIVAGAVLGVLAVVLVVRGAVGYYVGKQFGRPKASAAAGAIFGAPGVGAVALFGKSAD